jgi:hypothetical protein
LTAALLTGERQTARAQELVHITSNYLYDLSQPAQGVRVTAQITIENQDPDTQPGRRGYTSLTVPILAGSQAAAAVAPSGAILDVSLAQIEDTRLAGATVVFEEPLFHGDTYTFKLNYQLQDVKERMVLVTPVYVFLPLLASGDQATVTVHTPGEGWDVSMEAADCTRDGASFTCAGSEHAYIAGIVEASRPDATVSTSLQVPLREQAVTVNITYFEGQDEFAGHIAALAYEGLPVIEDLYGVTYFAPPLINIAERGRQVILGYEGITLCRPDACEIDVSPIADDYTILHELAHLWSGMYARRWLSEGFAQYIAERAALLLPEGLVTGAPEQRPPPPIDLQLDDWGEVESVIGASPDRLAIENAGYYRSLRFLQLLEFEVGIDALRRTNQLIKERGTPADSRLYIDLLEEASGRNNDTLFREWVFPDHIDATLAKRREARDRLTNLIAHAEQEGLSQDVPTAIQEDVDAWQFDAALAALAEAEAGLQSYDEIKVELAELQARVQAEGLLLADSISTAIQQWDFAGARTILTQAGDALSAYVIAREKVEAPRSLWRKFGLLGSHPERSLERSAAAFDRGDYQLAIDFAIDATDTIDGASATAVRRLLVVAGILSVLAIVILGAIVLSRLREREWA